MTYDHGAADAARRRHLRLTKPAGSLGVIEELGARLSGIAGACPPPVPAPAAVAVFAGDHGVLAEGVSPWPQEVTGQMVANFAAGGAAVNVLARQMGARVYVVDVGMAAPPPAGVDVLDRNVRRGTGNIAVEPAMTAEEAAAAVAVGAEVAEVAVAGGARCLVTGDMGIGNTTAAAALIAAITGRPAPAVTGRGTGIDDETLARKTAIVGRAVARAAPGADPLAEVGGLEIAALAGFIAAGSRLGVPVVVDGLISGAGLLVAATRDPSVLDSCFAGHRSVEPGATAVLEHLGMAPLLDLGLRLGEGTGALLALPLLEAAARILREMATFDDAGVSEGS